VVSFKRIAKFFVAEEMDGLLIETGESPYKLQLDGANYKWEKSENEEEKKDDKAAPKLKRSMFGGSKPAVVEVAAEEKVTDSFKLENLDIKIKTGSKVGVCGPVGSGKSSLLSAIIGEMPKTSGTIHRYGKVAYCAQQPWILTETVEGNITFNLDLDDRRLRNILTAVGLDADLAQFPNGRLTGIGEKGVNLSGGQKARVALARALYSPSDIYLLDDPISALDAHVGRFVFDKAIKTYLKEKTVLLVTHQLVPSTNLASPS
jgi:ATP-binding cassette, subfamily C (CFTR/MRP), member 1